MYHGGWIQEVLVGFRGIIGDEPEQAPHKRLCSLSVLSFCLSVRTFITQGYTGMVVICGVPLVVDSGIYGAFGELPCMLAFQQTCSDKQRERTGFILRKQVYQLLIKK